MKTFKHFVIGLLLVGVLSGNVSATLRGDLLEDLHNRLNSLNETDDLRLTDEEATFVVNDATLYQKLISEGNRDSLMSRFYRIRDGKLQDVIAVLAQEIRQELSDSAVALIQESSDSAVALCQESSSSSVQEQSYFGAMLGEELLAQAREYGMFTQKGAIRAAAREQFIQLITTAADEADEADRVELVSPEFVSMSSSSSSSSSSSDVPNQDSLDALVAVMQNASHEAAMTESDSTELECGTLPSVTPQDGDNGFNPVSSSSNRSSQILGIFKKLALKTAAPAFGAGAGCVLRNIIATGLPTEMANVVWGPSMLWVAAGAGICEGVYEGVSFVKQSMSRKHARSEDVEEAQVEKKRKIQEDSEDDKSEDQEDGKSEDQEDDKSEDKSEDEKWASLFGKLNALAK